MRPVLRLSLAAAALVVTLSGCAHAPSGPRSAAACRPSPHPIPAGKIVHSPVQWRCPADAVRDAEAETVRPGPRAAHPVRG